MELTKAKVEGLKARLLRELYELAAKENVVNRIEKIEEMHRRLNALDRVLGEKKAE